MHFNTRRMLHYYLFASNIAYLLFSSSRQRLVQHVPWQRKDVSARSCRWNRKSALSHYFKVYNTVELTELTEDQLQLRLSEQIIKWESRPVHILPKQTTECPLTSNAHAKHRLQYLSYTTTFVHCDVLQFYSGCPSLDWCNFNAPLPPQILQVILQNRAGEQASIEPACHRLGSKQQNAHRMTACTWRQIILGMDAHLKVVLIVQAHQVSTPEACSDCPWQEVLIQLGTRLSLKSKLATEH